MKEELAKTLWEIRCNQFPDWNRYHDDVSGDDDLSWDSLADVSDDPELVSKEYFRKLAGAVIERLGLV